VEVVLSKRASEVFAFPLHETVDAPLSSRPSHTQFWLLL
jgi:hypothetical protein